MYLNKISELIKVANVGKDRSDVSVEKKAVIKSSESKISHDQRILTNIEFYERRTCVFKRKM